MLICRRPQFASAAGGGGGSYLLVVCCECNVRSNRVHEDGANARNESDLRLELRKKRETESHMFRSVE